MKKKLLLVLALALALCMFAACDFLVDNKEVTEIIVTGDFIDAPYVLLGTEIPTNMLYREILRDGVEGSLEYVTLEMISGYNPNVAGYQTVTIRYNKDVKFTFNVLVVGTVVNNTNELKAALEDQADGQYWFVKNGTYDVQLMLNSDVTIIGESRNVVVTLSNYDDLQTVNYTDRYGTSSIDHAGMVTIQDCDVVIRNITILGNISEVEANKLNGVSNYGYTGVAIFDSSVELDNVLIKDFSYDSNGNRFGAQNGFGILAPTAAGTFDNGQTIIVNNCEITGFQKNAAVVRYVSELVFTNNTVEGLNENSKIAQNGVVYACDNATFTGNTFTNIHYLGSNTSVAIFFYAPDNAHNDVTETDFLTTFNVVVEANTFSNIQCRVTFSSGVEYEIV